MTLQTPLNRPSIGGSDGMVNALQSPFNRLATHTPHTPQAFAPALGGGMHAKNKAQFRAQ